MNDKDFAEVLACFKEAGRKKPVRVLKIDAPVGKPVRTKLASAHNDAEAVCAKAPGRGSCHLKTLKNPSVFKQAG